MSKLHFDYSMKLEYEEMVSKCHFTIKCIPRDTARQKLVNLSIGMNPEANYSYGYDGFQNQKIVGSVYEPHDHYYLDVHGDVIIDQVLYEELVSDNEIGRYRYPYGKTIPGEKLKAYHDQIMFSSKKYHMSAYNKALKMMQCLYRDFTYEANVTNHLTSAEEAFSMKKGVCQDYAHILIALCKLSGIPARYVTGLMIGEGASHAWVEIVHSGKWIGLDPTNNLLIDDNYIKLSHGRDAKDCSINLGIMTGGGKQTQEISASVIKCE